MKSLVFAGIAATALAAAGAPVSASDSFTAASTDAAASSLELAANGTKSGHGMGGKVHMPSTGGKMHMPRMGGKTHMPRMGGHMPGGKVHMPRMNHGPNGGTQIIRTGGYQRPFFGFALPSYWSAPSFYVTNYSNFGLSRPQSGYNWSRYYDDAVLRDSRGQVHDYRENIDWSRGGAGYAPNGYYQQQQPQGPTLSADQNAYGWGEESYRSPAPQGTTERGVYDGEWTGEYIDPENRVYRGEWTGKYINEEGQVYQGTYRGTATGDPVYSNTSNHAGYTGGDQTPYTGGDQVPYYPQSQSAYPAPIHAPQYQTPDGYYQYEKCLKGRGITGGAIGAIIGAVAGNRIGGRGNRLAGSLIGGGVGAISGALIEKAVNKCEKYLPSQHAQPAYPSHGYPQPQYPQSQYPQAQYPQTAYPAQPQAPSGYGWSNGYYWVPGGYYYPPATTTVTVIPGTMTTTTTTEYVEESGYASSGKRLMKPAGKRLTKPSCNC